MREQLVGLDDRARRISYTVLGGQAAHHHASAQVFAESDGRSRVVWITDVLPDALAEPIGAMMDRGALAMKSTLDAALDRTPMSARDDERPLEQRAEEAPGGLFSADRAAQNKTTPKGYSARSTR